MGLLDRLRNPAVAVAVGTAQGLMKEAGQLALNLRTAITGEEPISAEAAAELAVQAKQIEADILLAQAKINEAEAKSTSLFIAGWRPMLGWTCSIGIAIAFVVQPIVQWFIERQLPALDIGQLIALVVSMLGIAAYRTYEKSNGTVDLH